MKYISPHCGVSPETGSGGEVYERELLKGLAGMGDEIHILMAPEQPHETVPGWTVHPVGRGTELSWRTKPFILPPAIRRLHDQHHFDFLRVHAVRRIGPYVFLARKLYGLNLPIITTHHHLDPNPLNFMIEKYIIQHSDCVITDSDFSKNQLPNELGIDLSRVRVEGVYCGVGNKFKPMPKNEELLAKHGLQGKRIVLHHSSLKSRKNQRFILKAFQKIVQQLGDEVRLLLVGGGELMSDLKQQAQALGVSKQVIFTGYIPEGEKVSYLNLGDVYVFASLLEGFPLAPQEAMSCGVPPVALRAASLGEQIEHGVGGFLANPGEVDIYAGHVVELLKNEDLRKRFSLAARERIDHYFRWDKTVTRIHRIHEEVVEQYRKKHGR